MKDINDEDIARIFYKKELQKSIQTEFIVKKVIKKKGDKLYVQRKCINNLV